MNDLTLGQKIRNFRKRAGMSQLELELAIGASPGSISRIENGKVNPTKETLSKIMSCLSLTPTYMGYLYDVDFNTIPKMIELTNKLTSSLDLNTTLQTAVNEITNELNLLGAIILIKEKDTLYSKTITQSWYTQMAEKILGKKFKDHSISMNYTENACVRCVVENRILYTSEIYDFTVGVTSKPVAKIIQKFTGTKSGILIPFNFKNETTGCVLFTKNYDDNFSKELPILKSLVKVIGTAISNAKEYKKLKESFQISND